MKSIVLSCFIHSCVTLSWNWQQIGSDLLKNRAVCKSTVRHTACYTSLSLAAVKSLVYQKQSRKTMRKFIFALNSAVHFTLRVCGSVSSCDLLYASYSNRLLLNGCWPNSGPSSRKIQYFIYVWPFGVIFGTVWRLHNCCLSVGRFSCFTMSWLVCFRLVNLNFLCYSHLSIFFSVQIAGR